MIPPFQYLINKLYIKLLKEFSSLIFIDINDKLNIVLRFSELFNIKASPLHAHLKVQLDQISAKR